jgi:hypothetical protein
MKLMRWDAKEWGGWHRSTNTHLMHGRERGGERVKVREIEREREREREIERERKERNGAR